MRKVISIIFQIVAPLLIMMCAACLFWAFSDLTKTISQTQGNHDEVMFNSIYLPILLAITCLVCYILIYFYLFAKEKEIRLFSILNISASIVIVVFSITYICCYSNASISLILLSVLLSVSCATNIIYLGIKFNSCIRNK